MTDVDALLDRVRDRLRTPASCGVPRVDGVVADALRPGKLLRPAMVVRSAAAAGADLAAGDVRHAVVEAALAMELLHVATLVHDDIIDGADLRRGRASVVAQAGLSTAIVVGDLLLARGSAAAAASAPGVSTVWARALDLMAAGQLHEGELVDLPSLAAQAEYASLKTAELFRSSAEAGALAAGADAEVVAAHGRYGLHFGRAFQHVDDLLDRYGDPALTGKPTGADARNGVPTRLSLVPDGRGVDEVLELVVSELREARSSLPPAASAWGCWGVEALARATLVVLDDADAEVTARVAAAFARLEPAPHHPRTETQPCLDTRHHSCPHDVPA